MKKIWTAFLACLTFVCMALLASSCALLGGSSATPKLAFNEGYLEEVMLGEPIMLDEYIDLSLTDDYTAILTCDETGEDRDLKMLGQWTTDLPGTYTLTYTVNSGDYKGTISTKILVTVSKVTWQYSRPTLVYRVGETMEFNLLKRNLNLMVKSYYPYDFFVKAVQYNEDIKIDVSEQDSFTFEYEGDHIFTFSIKTEDGQELSADQKISVRPKQVLAPGAEEWMAENGITAYDYTLVSPDGKVSLDAGYYSSFINDNVPYLAFNGAEGTDGYGANTYMMVDFTGKNLPQVAFFCDEVTSSFTDGKNGILFSNGTSYNDGSFLSALDASRLTVFGPRKAEYAEFDNKGRMLALGSLADPCPLSYNALNDGDSYKYIIGIEDATANSVTARILLINMTTGERTFDYKQKLTGYSSPSGQTPLDLTDYFKGSIVLYGRYGIRLNFDKVYLPITGIDSIYELDVAAEFKDNYKETYQLNSYANVKDYIEIPSTDYEFSVIDPDGEVVEIAEDGTFQYTKSGTYLLRYNPMQEGVRISAVSVRVLYDFTTSFEEDFFEIEGAIIAGGDNGVIMNTQEDFIIEGSQSVKCYTINGGDGTISILPSKSFMEFIFLSREAVGISFEVYSLKTVQFALKGSNILQDYTGTIPAETWTTLTVTRDLCMRNFDVYKSAGYSLAIQLTPEEKFVPRECVYIDNIQILLDEVEVSIEDGAKTFMDENDITAYGYQTISDDMSVTLYGGMYQKEWYTIKNDDVPYLAYNGNYGAGSYVAVDFTGKNIPQLCFFAQEVTSSLTDGKAGLYVHTGMVKKNGELVSPHDSGRITFFGPNKMEYCRPDADGRVGHQGYQTNKEGAVITEASPLSIAALEDGVHYRYVAGIKSATEGRIELELLLINLDTNEEVVKYDMVITGNWITAEYLSGSIVMYSRYNQAITLDKVYAVYTNVSSVYDVDAVSEILG